MSVIGSNVLAGASGQSTGGGGGGGYQISRSVRFNNADNCSIYKTFSSAGDRKKWTLSFWAKRSGIATEDNMFTASGNYIRFEPNDKMRLNIGSIVDSTRLFRDPSAWYHIVWVWDTAQSTAEDRSQVYVNNEYVTFASYPSQNASSTVNNNVQHIIGAQGTGVTNHGHDGYLADFHFIDGQALAPTDFGETNTNNLWVPKAFSGTYSTSAVDYTSQAVLTGSLYSGAGGVNKIFDGTTATCGPDDGSYVTFTPSTPIPITSTFRIRANVSNTTGTAIFAINGSDVSTEDLFPSSGGIVNAASTWTTITGYTQLTSLKFGWDGNWMSVSGIEIDGVELLDSAAQGANSFHLDFADNSSNAALGTDTSGVSPANNWTVNNLSAGAGSNPTAKQNFDVVTYTGTGSSQSISSLAFQPDFVWIKNRGSAQSHALFDIVRGATKGLHCNLTQAEWTDTNTLTAFNSNGFTLNGHAVTNASSNTYVAWAWKAGGAAVSNTDGTITSQVSANASYGFSIVTANSLATNTEYSIGHSLNAVPKFIIAKNRAQASQWDTYHVDVGAGQLLRLNGSAGATSAGSNDSNFSTTPTSSAFYFKANGATNNYVFYCWSEVAGFSKFGSYTGNGSSTGPIITTGFKPALVIIKQTNTTGNWSMYDSGRNNSQPLYPNLANAEGTLQAVSFLDDGFQLDVSTAFVNASGGTYIYMAFAQTVPADPDGDSLLDTPTNGDTASDTGAGGEITGCYATLNSLYKGATLSDGNLKATKGSVGSWEVAASTIGMKQGKWYAEVTIGTGNHQIGIVKLEDAVLNASNTPLVDFYWGWGFINDGSTLRLRSYLIGGGGSTTNVAFGASGSNYVDGDVLGLAYDADTQAFSIYKNGSLIGDTTSTWVVPPPAGTYAFAISLNSGNVSWNFGQRAFAYAAPSGYKSLNTANLSSTIADGSQYFDTKLWTGNGTSQTIANYNFSPDFVWIKNRTSSSEHHALFDQVRGATKVLYSSLTNAEATQASGLSAFTSDGFSLGSDGKVNSSGHGQVGWAWDAGDSNTTIAVGGENSSVYDQSQTWSGMLTAETQGSVSNPTYAFDGTPGNTSSTSARTSPTSTQGGIIFTPTNGYTVASIIEVYGGSDSDECFIDFGSGYGSAVSLTSGTWNTVYTGSGTITYLKVKDPVGGNATGFGGIRIDGKLLVDSGVSVPNVPSIASTVRANPSAGFSIVSYTGTGAVATVGHGLNSTPELIIIKNRDTAKNWYVNTTAIDGSMDYLYLNLTNAAGASAAALPTSSVFGLTTSHETNTSGDDHIALLFAPVEGYSAMGSYTGNNTNDGPFVYTGFKPAFVMIKISSGATANWSIFDNKREGYNGSGQGNSRLYPNTSDQEATSATVDLFSNGFKCVRATNLTNGPSHEYIYFAVAEHPFASNGGLAR